MNTNEEIILKEQFKIDDSHSKVRGFVFAYDEDENLVFTKENMIVKSGRKFIMNNGIQEECFSAAFLSENMDMVTEDDVSVETDPKYRAEREGGNIPGLLATNFEDWKANDPKTWKVDESTAWENLEDTLDDSKNYFSYFIDRDNLIIKCMIIFNNGESRKASSLGLVAKYPSGFKDNTLKNKEVLFSRLTFPTYYKSPTQRLTFKYYIYF